MNDLTLYAVAWKLEGMPYLLDIDGENAEEIATRVAARLAETGRSDVTIMEHSAAIDEEISAALRVRFKRSLDAASMGRILNEIGGKA
jgi:hypothetical protein